MNIPQLALAAVAAVAAFSVFGTSPAEAAESPATHVAAVSDALPGSPVTASLGGVVDDVVAGVCGAIGLDRCESMDGDNWNDN